MEILADQVSAKFPSYLVLGNTNLVSVNQEFVLGSAGTQFTIPFWKRIAAFSDLTENVALTPGNITAARETATVLRGGGAFEILDTAQLVSMSDPVSEVSTQIARRAAEYIDGKLVTGAADKTPNEFDQNLLADQTLATGKIDTNAIIKAMTRELGDQHGALLQGGWIIMHSKVYGDLLQTGAIQNQYQIGANPTAITTGAVPMVAGLRIHVSDRVTSNTVSGILQYKTYLVAPGSLGLFYQRGVQVEFDRDILKFSDIISASVHFAVHLFGYSDATSAVVCEDDQSVHVVRINSK